MNLDEAQKKRVIEWIGQGLKLSDIQNRLISELGLRLTYMEVRLLVDDLKLVPKDIEPSKPAPSPLNPAGGSAKPEAQPEPGEIPEPAGTPDSAGGVSVSVDQLARPGALVSGKVTFSDGHRAEWHLDQSGRLGLATATKGYRPSAPDLQEFQAALQAELARMGF